MTTISAFAAALLRKAGRAYAAAVVARLHEERPALMVSGLPATFARPIDDLEVRLLHLAGSLEFDRPALLEHSIRWYRVAFHHRGVPDEYLIRSLETMQSVLSQELPNAAAAVVRRHLEAARRQAETAAVDVPGELDVQAPHGRLAGQFLMAILEGRGDDAVEILRAALAAGVSVTDFHDAVLLPVQREVGRMWLMAEIPIADEHYGSRIVDRALWVLQDHVPRAAATAPTVTTMAVGGNLHDLGLRIVAQRMQAAGLAVNHLGADMPDSDLEWAFTDRRVDLVAISATMVIHLHNLAATIETVRRITGGKVPVLVGGEPFKVVADLHTLVGADAAATDAAGAAAAAWALLRS